MTRRKWAELRALNLQTPEARERYEAARKQLDIRLAAFRTLEELAPEASDLSDLWEAIDDGSDADFDSLRRRLWAVAHERGITDSPGPPPAGRDTNG